MENNKIIGKFGKFTLKEYDSWNLYLEKEGGEVVTIKKAVFEAHVNNFFERMNNPKRLPFKKIKFINS